MPSPVKNQPRPNSLVNLLNQSLSLALDLKLQVKQAHWNVKGENFIALHKLFDEVATDVDDYADMLAERAVQLGGIAHGTVQAVAKSGLPPYPADAQDSRQHVKALTNVMRDVADQWRDAIDESDDAGDAVTADLFTEIARGLDKWRWFVESHMG